MATPSAPRVGQRRKGVNLPKLPLSAFSPPNSSASEKFPLPASPTTTHPPTTVDGNVYILNNDAALSRWKTEAGPNLASRISGVVVSAPDEDLGLQRAMCLSFLSQFLSVWRTAQPTLPDYAGKTSLPISLKTTYKASGESAIASLRWALEQGHPVDIDVQTDISDANLEAFEELITKASDGINNPPPMILSNVLPPPHDLGLPMVKLMNHPAYRAFETQTAALSLFPNLYIKFLPPSWNAPTPPTPHAGQEETDTAEAQQKREWKRRIKMYLGPVIEAFGFSRVIFGSSPSPSARGPSHAGDWYEIARESLAELSGEQEFIDGVFSDNAKKVYGKAKA
ncbi:hypothetical protein DL96DRAFT_1555594 [Flagelloscypha sp. PMI_526]|nr:hypothetical protein DL96DRAFT_1555594 [Flagelloscypha sp. PMI_526]